MMNRLFITAFLCCFSIVAFSQMSKTGKFPGKETTLTKVENPLSSGKVDRSSETNSTTVTQNGQKRTYKIDEGYSVENQIQEVKNKILDLEDNPQKYQEVGANTSELLTHYKKSLIVLEKKKLQSK